MDFKEAVAIVEQFNSAHPLLMHEPGVHGVQVEAQQHGHVLVVVVEPGFDRRASPMISALPPRFSYSYSGGRRVIGMATAERPRAQAHTLADPVEPQLAAVVRAGDSARGVDLNGSGTAGWSLILNGNPVCMSNWHVLCGLGNQTPLGRRVLLAARDLASLHAYEPLNLGSGINTWDFALAKYDNVNDACDCMRPCEDGSVAPYPQRLSPSIALGDGAVYRKVGNRQPTCRQGMLQAIGSRLVDYKTAGTAIFDKQLIFTKMSDPGDSGSVIVRVGDTTVTGLNFAGDDQETVANPIFIAPWTYRGSFSPRIGVSIPMFTSKGPKPFSALSEDVHQGDAAADAWSAPEALAITPFDLPQLISGYVLLGVAYGNWDDLNGRVVSWIVPPPPPTSGRGTLNVVTGFFEGPPGAPRRQLNPNVTNRYAAVVLVFEKVS